MPAATERTAKAQQKPAEPRPATAWRRLHPLFLTFAAWCAALWGRSFHRPPITDCSKGDRVYTTSLRRIGALPMLPARREKVRMHHEWSSLYADPIVNLGSQPQGATESRQPSGEAARRDLRLAGLAHRSRLLHAIVSENGQPRSQPLTHRLADTPEHRAALQAPVLGRAANRKGGTLTATSRVPPSDLGWPRPPPPCQDMLSTRQRPVHRFLKNVQAELLRVENLR